ncbi:MAG: hypothetical protein PHV37_03990 [Candidatus Gastranaerophilales bacterium]|nr:hypothetical protein [Candidatus Gastranaerophilales bacterium]
MKVYGLNYNKERHPMREIWNFIQEILMLKQEDTARVGLTQFKYAKQPIKQPKPVMKKSDLKISDLMRRSY